MKNILAKMGEIYTGAEINSWMAYHYRENTPYKRVVIDFLRAYGNYGIAHPDRLYMICRTSDYPKSAAANGNRNGEYMLRRIGGKNHGRHNRKKRWTENMKRDIPFVKPVRDDLNVFYL